MRYICFSSIEIELRDNNVYVVACVNDSFLKEVICDQMDLVVYDLLEDSWESNGMPLEAAPSYKYLDTLDRFIDNGINN